MKKQTSGRSILLACAITFALAAASHARWSSSKDYELRHSDVVVEEGQTMREDVVTDKAITIIGTLRGDCVSLGGPVAVKGTVTGDLVSLGGPVNLSGSIQGNLISIGAPVETEGLIAGDLVSIGASVTLKAGATVQGEVSSIGGHIEQGDGVTLKGGINSVNLNMLKRIVPSLMRVSRGAHRNGNSLNPLLFGGLLGLGLIALCSLFLLGAVMLVLPAIFFPKNVATVSREITENFWKSAGIGALIVMALFPALLMMAVSILGIPLIPLALLLLGAAKVLGFCGFSVVLTKRFFEGIKRPAPASLITQVCIGYGLLAAALFIGHAVPLLGWLLSLAGIIVIAFGVLLGLGAVWSTRMGTMSGTAPQPQVPPAVPPAAPAQPAAPPVTPA
ncbi:MAG: hypothetical protein KKH28_05725 [Elusimicrobia bacterium]|nr:hypothetical protein [Elusimicrobiota bacterium]